MIPLPIIPSIGWRAIAFGAAVFAIAGAGLYIRHTGYTACETDHRAALAEHLQRGIEQAQAMAKQDAEVSEYYERIKTRIETQIITVRDEVAHEVPADCLKCSLSAHGLQRLNDALRGVRTPAADPQQPDGPVPGVTAPPRWQLPGGLRPPGGDGPALLKLRGETQFAGEGFSQP